jgi:hypothetical protein
LALPTGDMDVAVFVRFCHVFWARLLCRGSILMGTWF